MLRVAVLGAGFMGGTHARAYAALDDVQVVGVSSRSLEKARRLADEVGAEASTDAMALATRSDVDAVSVTLPTHLHEHHAVAALEAGKDVFVEKPMELSDEACARMIEAAERHERLLMVAHVLRFWPEYRAIASELDSGRLGRPLTAHARRLSTRPDWGDWFAEPEWTGGGLHDMLVHDFDVFNWLFGTPERVFARGQKGEAGGWDHVFALVDHGGVQGMAEGSVMMPADYPFTMALWVTCERGAIEFTFRAEGTGVETGGQDAARLVRYPDGGAPERVTVEPADGYAAQVAEFAACAAEGRTPQHGTAAQGRAAVQVALAARRSLDRTTVERP